MSSLSRSDAPPLRGAGEGETFQREQQQYATAEASGESRSGRAERAERRGRSGRKPRDSNATREQRQTAQQPPREGEPNDRSDRAAAVRKPSSVSVLLLDNVSFFCISAMLVSIKAYGKGCYKVIYHKNGRRASGIYDVEGGVGKGVATSAEKEECNLYRAKSKVREIALCNEWQYFVTLTLDKRKQDRHDLDGYIRDLGVWIGNYNKKYRTKMTYLLIPEQHQDGAYHLHGLFSGVAPESLIKNEYGYLDMPYYGQRFGYISLSPVRDGKRTASYITKYVAKAFGHTQIGLFKHTYYRSRGLQEAYTLGEFCAADIPADVWQNDFCGIQWIDGDEQLQALISTMEGGVSE